MSPKTPKCRSHELGFGMATWDEVLSFLEQNYESDFGMKMLAGPDSYAAVVNHEQGSEVILIFNIDDFIVQFVGFLDRKALDDIDGAIRAAEIFGVKRTSDAVALQHVAFLETLDTQEITLPLALMAQEMHSVNQKL